MYKQVILMRSDLKNKNNQKVHTGKLIAQACHASMQFLIDLELTDLVGVTSFNKWLDCGAKKIVLKVTYDELINLHIQACKSGLNSYLITDAGYTEFNEPTITCCAIGPHEEDKFDFTKHLSLF